MPNAEDIERLRTLTPALKALLNRIWISVEDRVRAIIRMLHPKIDAQAVDEIAQTVAIKLLVWVIKHSHRFPRMEEKAILREVDNLLWKTVENQCLTFFRSLKKAGVEPAIGGDPSGRTEAIDDRGPLKEILRRERREVIDQFARLNPECWRLMSLRVSDDLSWSQVAEGIGVKSDATAKRHYEQCLRNLLLHLERHGY